MDDPFLPDLCVELIGNVQARAVADVDAQIAAQRRYAAANQSGVLIDQLLSVQSDEEARAATLAQYDKMTSDAAAAAAKEIKHDDATQQFPAPTITE